MTHKKRAPFVSLAQITTKRLFVLTIT